MTENYEQENENVIWINEYPLQETYDRIDRALDQRIDWRTIIDTARAEKYAAFDVSWVVVSLRTTIDMLTFRIGG